MRLFVVGYLILLLSGLAHGQTQTNAYTHSVPTTSNVFFGASNPSINPNAVPQTFTDISNNVTVSFDLIFTLDWITFANGLAGFTEDASSGVGGRTTVAGVTRDGGAPESAELEDLNVNGLEALERISVTVANVNVTGLSGSASFVGFKNATVTSSTDVFVNAAGPTTMAALVTHAISGGNGGHLTGFDLEFITEGVPSGPTAVPEPNQISTFLLLGFLLAGRSWRSRRLAH